VSSSSGDTTQWRAIGPYVPNLAGKATLLEESRALLAAYVRLGDARAACQALVDGELPQRSRATRAMIVRTLRERFLRWQPPTWVLDELVALACQTSSPAFPPVVLLHMARQDALLYDFVQQVIVPHWFAGTAPVIRSDVQAFLDTAQDEQSQIQGWSHATREKVSRNVLTVLRDCTLLKGEVKKQIVLPMIPEAAAHHLIRLLLAEGVAPEKVAQHLDWRLWLWETNQVQKTLDRYLKQEQRL
jgi:hypothetical protein